VHAEPSRRARQIIALRAPTFELSAARGDAAQRRRVPIGGNFDYPQTWQERDELERLRDELEVRITHIVNDGGGRTGREAST
jgi:hypothetical protein